jgi:predicted DNA-binding transcriptional regulator
MRKFVCFKSPGPDQPRQFYFFHEVLGLLVARDDGLTKTDLRVFLALASGEVTEGVPLRPQKMVAEELGVSPQRVSQAVRRLLRKGYLRKLVKEGRTKGLWLGDVMDKLPKKPASDDGLEVVEMLEVGDFHPEVDDSYFFSKMKDLDVRVKISPASSGRSKS